MHNQLMAFLAAPSLPLSARPRAARCQARRKPGPRASADQISSEDWRAFRARLVQQQSQSAAESDASFAHKLVVPETGALLVANPSLFTEQQAYFHHAVILLFMHNNEGSAGIILNRPHHASSPTPIPPPPFQDHPVRLGGDVGNGSLFACYPTPDSNADVIASDACVVLPGVSLTVDVDELARGVTRGVCDRSQVRFYTKYCGWAAGQLESELERDVWYLASVSSNYVTSKDTDSLYARILEQLDMNQSNGT